MVSPTIGVFAAAFDDQGRILCVRQAYGQERWTNPGGRLEDDEDPRAGVLRELHKETGFHGTVVGFLGTYVALYKAPMDIVLFFRVQLRCRDPWRPNSEISACNFFSEADLPTPMAFNTRIRTQDAFRKPNSMLRLFATAETLAPQHDYSEWSPAPRSFEKSGPKIAETAVQPADRGKLGSLLAAIGREAGLTDAAVDALQKVRDKTRPNR